MSLYYSLIEREYKAENSISKVETHTIDTLDRIANEGKVDNDFKDLFVQR